jgi:hypothetical protein
MNAGQLIQMLQDALEDGRISEETEVRLVYQENYPLQSTIRGIWIPETDPETLEDLPQNASADDEPLKAIYIVESEQCRDTPYGDREAFTDCERPWGAA